MFSSALDTCLTLILRTISSSEILDFNTYCTRSRSVAHSVVSVSECVFELTGTVFYLFIWAYSTTLHQC